MSGKSALLMCLERAIFMCFIFAAFTCHDQGASSLAYAPQHQLLISAGKKGDICIFDVRQRVLRHRFQVSNAVFNKNQGWEQSHSLVKNFSEA